MRILIGTLFITLSAVFSDCIVPDHLAPILQRHRGLIPISHGIHYFGAPSGKIRDMSQFLFNKRKFSFYGFIIRIECEGFLHPIYDADEVQVIVSENGMGNTPLRMDEIARIPYNNFGNVFRREIKEEEFFRRARKEIRRIKRQ